MKRNINVTSLFHANIIAMELNERNYKWNDGSEIYCTNNRYDKYNNKSVYSIDTINKLVYLDTIDNIKKYEIF